MFFVTGNSGKFAEAAGVIPGLVQADLGVPELQADTLEEVASFSVGEAYKELGERCFVEDAGLFVDGLKGFPGVYSRFVEDTIGPPGIVKLLEGVENRNATIAAVIAYHDGKDIHLFRGESRGTIALELKGSEGFGVDPIFIPDGKEKTFAEDFAYKERVSHRARALAKFVAFLGKPL